MENYKRKKNRQEITNVKMILFVFFVCIWCNSPTVGQGLLIHEVSRSHSTTHHSQQDSSGRVISLSQRPLPDNTHDTHNRETSMPPVGFESTISAGEQLQTARPLGLAQNDVKSLKINNAITNNPQTIANTFNEYVLTVAETVISNIKQITVILEIT